jgi:hypothetical protein
LFCGSQDSIEYKWTLTEDGAYRISLRYFAKWRALASIAAGVLTAGISAAVGAVTYSNAIRDAEMFFENMWLRIERHVGQPEERIILEKVGFGRYEPQWNEEEQRLMNAHQNVPPVQPVSSTLPMQSTATPVTQFAPTPSEFGYTSGATASNLTGTGVTGAMHPPGFVPAQTATADAQPALVSGFGGEPSFSQPSMSDIKVIHKPGTIGETLLNPGNPNVIDPNIPTSY